MRVFTRKKAEINSGSMADIAFLLLIFFLISTTIQTDKGLNAMLPPYTEEPDQVKIHDRNLFKIHVNSNDQILVEGQPFTTFSLLHVDLKQFVLNNGEDPTLSDSPSDAIVSLQMNRGTSYHRFIEVMDAVQGVYYEIYGERVDLSASQFRALDLKKSEERARYDRARQGIPMNISIAEPRKID